MLRLRFKNMVKFFKQKNKGFTLVETLIAISIFSMTIVTMMSILGSGISDTNYAKRKMIAGYLAQEGIECARNARDNYFTDPSKSWSQFVAAVNDVSTVCSNVSSDFAGFTRTIQMTSTGN